MTKKNDSMSFLNTASLLGMSSELFSIVDIISLPSEANYTYQEILNVLHWSSVKAFFPSSVTLF